MFSDLIVPVDPWSDATRHIRIAAELAAAVGGSIEVLTVVDRIDDLAPASVVLQGVVDGFGTLPVEAATAVVAGDSVAAAVAARLDARPGSMVVMGSHGRGRSAAVMGSTADAVLRETFGPVIVVGPNAGDSAGRVDGTYVVPLDGSDRADGVIPIVSAWTVEFGGTPWLVEVLEPAAPQTDVAETAFVARRAHAVGETIGRPIEFEALHGSPPGREVVNFATTHDASLIFMATHGRTGLARLRAGSVAADVVRHARCPVVLFRPPNLVDVGEDEALATSDATR